MKFNPFRSNDCDHENTEMRSHFDETVVLNQGFNMETQEYWVLTGEEYMEWCMDCDSWVTSNREWRNLRRYEFGPKNVTDMESVSNPKTYINGE